MAVLVDEEDRENEGDLIFAADFVTPEKINFMATHGRGLICMPMTAERAARLNARADGRAEPLGARHQFHRVDRGRAGRHHRHLRSGSRTHDTRRRGAGREADRHRAAGSRVSADRATGRRARARGAHRGMLRPRHARGTLAVGGALRNHERATARWRGCPISSRFAAEHGLKIGAIADLIHYRSRTERLVERIAERPLATAHGAFRLVVYRDKLSDATHLALVRGPISPRHRNAGARARAAFRDGPARHRRHVAFVEHRRRAERDRRRRAAASSCCCTGPRARSELRQRALAAEPPVSSKVDLRNYGIGAQILRDLNVGKMRLLAKPRKMPSMTGFDLEVTGYVEQPAARRTRRSEPAVQLRARARRPAAFAQPCRSTAFRPARTALAGGSASCFRGSTPASAI